jgi:hypothetical protein
MCSKPINQSDNDFAADGGRSNIFAEKISKANYGSYQGQLKTLPLLYIFPILLPSLYLAATAFVIDSVPLHYHCIN